MSNDLPAPGQAGRSADVEVLQWGPDETPRRGRIGRHVEMAVRDPRIPPVIAALGALATFAAMTDDWIVIRLPDSGPDGSPMPLFSGVSELGSLGVAYLTGTLALLGCLALALFGSAGIRHNARVVGLALAAGTGGALLAVTATMDRSSRTLFLQPSQDIDITSGRGLVMAYIATAAFAAALLAASPTRPLGAARTVATPAPAGPGRDGDEQHAAGLGGDSRHSDHPDGDDLPPPADLTVLPAMPFTRPHSAGTRPEPPVAQPNPPFTRPDSRFVRPGPASHPDRPVRPDHSDRPVRPDRPSQRPPGDRA